MLVRGKSVLKKKCSMVVQDHGQQRACTSSRHLRSGAVQVVRGHIKAEVWGPPAISEVLHVPYIHTPAHCIHSFTRSFSHMAPDREREGWETVT